MIIEIVSSEQVTQQEAATILVDLEIYMMESVGSSGKFG